MEKLGQMLKQSVYSLYELLLILWNKSNDIIDSLNNKVDNDGNFNGTWHGLLPSQADETTASLVQQHEDRIDKHDIELSQIIKLEGLKTSSENPTFDNATIINTAISDINGQGTLLLPKGTYNFSTTINLNKANVRIIGSGIDNTILEYKGNGVAVLMDGSTSLGYRSNHLLKDLTIFRASKSGADIGVKTLSNASFKLDTIKITGFSIGLQSNGSLIWNVEDSEISNCNLGIEFKDTSNTDIPVCNLIKFTNCRIILNINQAIKYIGHGTGIIFDTCEIENNGIETSGLNVCHFEGINDIGVQPSIIFQTCWIENNKGLSDIYFRGFSRYGGLVVKECGFYSTKVNYNIDADNGCITFDGVGLNSTAKTKNLLLGANTYGYLFNNVIATFSNNGSCVVIDTANKMYGVQSWGSGSSSEWWLNGVDKTTLSHNGGTADFEINPAYALKVMKQLKLGTFVTMTSVSAGTVSNSSIFMDSADGKLKFKDFNGVVQLLY